MDALILRLPEPSDEAPVWAYRQVFIDGDESADGTGGLRDSGSFSAWLNQSVANRRAETVKPGLVPATTFLAVSAHDGALVGFVDIRHTLNDHLFNFGGHIGYSVHPAQRRKGYATEMLRLALCFCRDELGLDRVLVTCDKSNEPSRRTILTNGGALEDERDLDGEPVQRYWIAI